MKKPEKEIKKMASEEKSSFHKFIKNLKATRASEIEDYKNTHKDITLIVIGTSKDPKYVILRKPSISDLSHASVIGGQDAYKYNGIVLKDCWLEGDEEIKTDTNLFLSIMPHLDNLITLFKAEVVKL